MSRRELKALRGSQRSPPKKQSRLRSGLCASMEMEHESDGNEALMAETEREPLEASVADEQKMEQLEALLGG